MIIIAAGSNLPFCGIDSQCLIVRAFGAIGRFADVQKISPLYESPAWPNPDDPTFINAVAIIETDLEPDALLAALHAVEAAFGRRRGERNAPRTLDLDLVAYGPRVEHSEGDDALSLPHPRLAQRGFVLAPLCDLAPDWKHPVTGATASSMLEQVSCEGLRPVDPG